MSTAPVSTRNDLATAADDDWSPITATDGELLMRFTRHRDSAAFAEIVERHAGMVWIVCREALGHHHDVEDAFQATFFILAQQAAKIRSCDSAAAWLYKVAQRTALAARQKRAQRREEGLATELPHDSTNERLIHDQQMVYVLMEELRTLPERYRTPLVLRYLEGRTRRTIAAQTDSTLPQVQGRLVRGRRLLRSRMAQRGVSLAMASGVMTGLVAEAGAAVPASLAAGTTKSCVGLVTAGAVSGASAAAIELAKQGIKAMWLASFLKSSAVVSAVFVAAGVAWAVESGGKGGGIGASAPATAAALQVTSAQGENAEKSPAAATVGHEAQTTAPETTSAQQLLERRIANSRDVLVEIINKKSNQSAELELLQNHKSQLKRELERLDESLAVIRTPSSADMALDKAAKDQRAELATAIFGQSKSLRDELSEITMRTAKLSADLEVLQMDLQRKQRRLEELDRLSEKLQGDATGQAYYESKVSPTAINVDRVNTATIKVDKKNDGTLDPGDTIRVQVQNALVDWPLNSVFTVEPVGTVALGPAYGRVIVRGMNVLEAQEAIRKHLAKVIEKPEVQVTLSGKQTSTRELQELYAAIDKLRAENDELKLMSQDMQKQSGGVNFERSGTENDVLRPGDPIELTLWPRDSKDAGQVLRLRVNGDGAIQINPKDSPIAISGVSTNEAAKLIRDFFGKPTSRYEEVRVRRFDPMSR